MSYSSSLLPIPQSASNFNPPTQLTVPGNRPSTRAKVYGKISSLITRSSTQSSFSASGSGQSYTVIQTPKVLFPQTPTPMTDVHPTFYMNSTKAALPVTTTLSSTTMPVVSESPRVVAAESPKIVQQTPMPVPISNGYQVVMPAPAAASATASASSVTQPMQPMSSMMVVSMPAMYTMAAPVPMPMQMMQMPTAVQGIAPNGVVTVSQPVVEAATYSKPVEIPAGAFPSIGSRLHGTGQCQPCAWFWKPGRGCQLATNCDHCHLCPEGELKARKRAKVAALRAGSA